MTKETKPCTDCDTCKKVLNWIKAYGGIDGGHHKQWVLDKIVRAITGDKYDEWVHDYEFEETDEDGNPEYEWDTGIAP